MVTKHKLDEARDLVDKAQQDDDIFGKTATAIGEFVYRMLD
ncbi:MAG: hypothetical protein VYE35_09030 [Chloroflexota bacterium]|nr:hypothetical protein [Chloroflexota bacterium]